MPRAKLAKMAIEELKKEILRRTRVLPKLIAMRDALDSKIAELQGLGAVQVAPKLSARAFLFTMSLLMLSPFEGPGNRPNSAPLL